MPKEVLLPKDTTLSGGEYIRMVDDIGRSVIVPISVFNGYVQKATYFSIFDGATSGSGYSETEANITSIDLPARLGLSGPKTDSDYWASAYGNVIENSNSAPESSNFDFRLMTDVGIYIEFDVEFKARLADDSGFRLDREYSFNFEVTYPNGDVQAQVVTIPNEYIVTTIANAFNYKLTFSTYIKDVLLDSLRGGSMRFVNYNNPLGASEIVTLTDLKVTARL